MYNVKLQPTGGDDELVFDNIDNVAFIDAGSHGPSERLGVASTGTTLVIASTRVDYVLFEKVK
jgi:hypothetical protein